MSNQPAAQRVASVTDSGNGLGRACALGWAERGMTVIVNDWTVAAAIYPPSMASWRI